MLVLLFAAAWIFHTSITSRNILQIRVINEQAFITITDAKEIAAWELSVLTVNCSIISCSLPSNNIYGSNGQLFVSRQNISCWIVGGVAFPASSFSGSGDLVQIDLQMQTPEFRVSLSSILLLDINGHRQPYNYGVTP